MTDIIIFEDERVVLQEAMTRARLVQRVRVLESMLAISKAHPEIDTAVRRLQIMFRRKCTWRKQCAMNHWRHWTLEMHRLKIVALAFQHWHSMLQCQRLQRVMMRTRALVCVVQRRFRIKRATRRAIIIQRAWRMARTTTIYAIKRELIALRDAVRDQNSIVRQLRAQLVVRRGNKNQRRGKKEAQKISNSDVTNEP